MGLSITTTHKWNKISITRILIISEKVGNNTTGTSQTTPKMVWENYFSKMEVGLKGIFRRTELMVKVFSIQQMER